MSGTRARPEKVCLSITPVFTGALEHATALVGRCTGAPVSRQGVKARPLPSSSFLVFEQNVKHFWLKV
jgi:hypothetical protein